MSEGDVRPRRRDWLYVGLLALVLTVGLVHFGRQVSDADRSPAVTASADSATPTAQPTAAPSSDQARLESSPTSAPAEPSTAEPTDGSTAESPGSTAGTCWDGRPTTAIALCGLPEGTRGLEWVFPSFDPDRASCRRARPSDGTPAYTVVTSYVCFERALGQPVTITYDQVADPDEVEAWMERQVGADHVIELPGAHGGRCLMLDTDQRPARISGMYEKYPYVVSVFAPTKNSAQRAYRSLVLQRPSGLVLGVRGA